MKIQIVPSVMSYQTCISIRNFFPAYKYKPSGNIFSERLIWFILSNSFTEFPV